MTIAALDDGETFGRGIAACVVAEVRSTVTTIALAEVKQERLGSIMTRVSRAISVAASARKVDGLPQAEAVEWARHAWDGFAAAMHAQAAEGRSAERGRG